MDRIEAVIITIYKNRVACTFRQGRCSHSSVLSLENIVFSYVIQIES